MASTSSLAPVCRGPCFLRTSEFRKAGTSPTATGAPLLKRRKEWHCFAKQHWLAAGIGGREESKRRVPEFGADSTSSGKRRNLHRQVHARSQDEQSNLSSQLENREQTDVQSPGHSGSPSASSSKPPTETSTTHSDAEVGSSEGNGVSEGARAVSASAAEVVGGAELPPDFWEDTYLPATTRRDLEAASPLQTFLFPDKEELPDDVEMSVWDHLEELRQRVFVSVGAVGACILLCFAYANQLVKFLEAPVASTGVRFLQLSPGEYFFVTLKAAGYSGLLLGSPVILYEIVAFVLPGLTRSERRFLAPIVLGSSVLFYAGLAFSYNILVPAALNFFVTYAENVVESIWSIDQYFEFVLVLLFSTGLAFQVPVIQLLLGSTGLFNSQQMFSIWKYVVVGAVVAAAVLTPSTDPLTQILLAGPLIGLYFGGAAAVRLTERAKGAT